MSLYILDTDTLSLSQHGHAAVNARVLALPPGELAITVLVTRNLRDFRRVPNLVVEDWAV
jgi:hypothetical protein